ncbi:MAG: FAD-dependent oxidoreductase [Siphonobacter sp.]
MKNIGIVGGGIMGLCSAYYLQQAGYQVTIIDQGNLDDGCSYGNAGMIVPSHIIPLAQPGMISKGLRWMLHSTSPFYVKPRLNAELIRWGWLFYRHSTQTHVDNSIPVLRDLSLFSKSLYQELASSLPFGWLEKGLFMLYKTASAEKEMEHEAHVANQAGVEARILTQAQVQALEPEVEVSVLGGIHYPGDAHVTPQKVMEALLQFLTEKGVTFIRQEGVKGFCQTGSQITAIQTTKQQISVDALVVATGAWSPEVVKSLGLSLPLQGGKGYSILAKKVKRNIQVPAILLEARATATPMGEDLRFAGTLEINGTDLSINPNRVLGIRQAIPNYYPELGQEAMTPQTVWSGLRPCSPDGLPYMGRIPGLSNAVLATGHGMMGLSLGPATGKLVAEVLDEKSTSLDLSPFRVDRFS